jgi:hypothetical protein
MALNSNVRMEGGAPISGAYVRVHSINLKKDRNSSANVKHYLTYDVSIYINAEAAAADPDSQNALYCRELQHFKIREVDPTANLSALAYANLKTKIVALEWEANTGAIEDV